MQKKVSYAKTLESRIIGSQYEIAPSVYKHKIENHLNKNYFNKSAKENTEFINFAEESALKAEMEFSELKEKTKKLKADRENNVKQIIKQNLNMQKKIKFKEFIKKTNQKTFSKEKKDMYNEMIRKQIIDKKRDSNFNTNNLNNVYDLQNLENRDNNNELFYHTIRVNKNGDLKSNMLINEFEENYDLNENEKINAHILSGQNSNFINRENENIKIQYEESDFYNLANENLDIKDQNIFNKNRNNLNFYRGESPILNLNDKNYNIINSNNNVFYEEYNKNLNNEFSLDTNNENVFLKDPGNFEDNNFLVANSNCNLNNYNYSNNDSFNIFKENQDLLNKQNQFNNNENIIIEVNENEENNIDESNKEKDFKANIIEKNKECEKSNVVNLRDDIQQKINEKLKQKQIEIKMKIPYFSDKNDYLSVNENSNSRIRDVLANSKLTFGENLTQDIYNISSGNNQISSCTEINFTGINTHANGNLKNKKNNFYDRSFKNKSFDSISLQLNANNNNNNNNYFNNCNDFNTKHCSEKNTIYNKVNGVEINRFLDKKINKIKAFRKSGNFANIYNEINSSVQNQQNFNNELYYFYNTDGNCNLEENNERDSFHNLKTENSSLEVSKNNLEYGYRTYNMAMENKKREMLKKKMQMSQTTKSPKWNNNTTKIIKRF